MVKGTRELLKDVKTRVFMLEHTADGIRNRPDYDRPAIRAMFESDLLMVVELLQEVEAYLLSHMPKAELVVLPSRQAVAPKTIAKKRKSPKESNGALGRLTP